jgi:hypothetical protein
MLSNILRKLALAFGAVVMIGAANIAPAKAWYDAYGYWHPNHRYYEGERYRLSQGERHRLWCERHPYECGYRPSYGYGYRPSYGYYNPWNYEYGR